MSLKYQSIHSINCLRYYRHGVRHRIGRPATVWVDGDMVWLAFGQIHRIDGPAENFGKLLFYFIRGIEYTKEDYESKIRSNSHI